MTEKLKRIGPICELFGEHSGMRIPTMRYHYFDIIVGDIIIGMSLSAQQTYQLWGIIGISFFLADDTNNQNILKQKMLPSGKLT